MLSKRNNSEGLTALRTICLDNFYAAKAAVTACTQLGVESFFEWFSEKLTKIPDQALLSLEAPYGHVLDRLQPIVHKDQRWSEWLNAHTGSDYSYLDPLRKSTSPPELQLKLETIENLKALEQLAAQQSPLVLEWIVKRVAAPKEFSREEYFSIVESLRLLNNPSGTQPLKKLIYIFKPSGFAKDFADEVLANLGKQTIQ
jgi:hypothetical protein